MPKHLCIAGACCLAALAALSAGEPTRPAPILQAEAFKHYIERFNANDNELYVNSIPNAAAWAFLKDNIPLFDCPDKMMEEIYYFRWWTYRKHIKQTPVGRIITEFLPNVEWAGKYNSINCPAAHHLYEGRWLHDTGILDDYCRFWFHGGGSPRSYSFWAADAYWNRFLVTGNAQWIKELLPELVDNYKAWEETHLDANGLFWQIDDRDGMEYSLGGSGYRPTINSYQFGDAQAIARIADLAGTRHLAEEYQTKATTLKQRVQENLWNRQDQFFETLPRLHESHHADVRELIGFTPWYFNLPDAGYEEAWAQLMDTRGFFAEFGPTTAEQRSPKFVLSYSGHECQWNGPSWPFATSVTLTAAANLLVHYHQTVVTKKDYFKLLRNYAQSQHLKREDGMVVPWIDENLHPYTGDWISRTRLMQWSNGMWDRSKGGVERGKDYNHSTFCDLIITGLVGLRPRADDVLEVQPLLPEGTWEYFCLDNVSYHGRTLAILYDKTGTHYGFGSGLRVLVDGMEVASSAMLGPITATIRK